MFFCLHAQHQQRHCCWLQQFVLGDSSRGAEHALVFYLPYVLGWRPERCNNFITGRCCATSSDNAQTLVVVAVRSTDEINTRPSVDAQLHEFCCNSRLHSLCRLHCAELDACICNENLPGVCLPGVCPPGVCPPGVCPPGVCPPGVELPNEKKRPAYNCPASAWRMPKTAGQMLSPKIYLF